MLIKNNFDTNIFSLRMYVKFKRKIFILKLDLYF